MRMRPHGTISSAEGTHRERVRGRHRRTRTQCAAAWCRGDGKRWPRCSTPRARTTWRHPRSAWRTCAGTRQREQSRAAHTAVVTAHEREGVHIVRLPWVVQVDFAGGLDVEEGRQLGALMERGRRIVAQVGLHTHQAHMRLSCQLPPFLALTSSPRRGAQGHVRDTPRRWLCLERRWRGPGCQQQRVRDGCMWRPGCRLVGTGGVPSRAAAQTWPSTFQCLHPPMPTQRAI
jgi:hypothetical protein